jgi:hypothetical protein
MQWDAQKATWEAYFNLASDYYEKNKDLKIPYSYITDNGLRLGLWIRRMRSYYKNKSNYLSPDKIKLLQNIGMVWEVRNEYTWEEYYNCADAYYKTFKHLLVPIRYVDKYGVPLGKWINQIRKLSGTSDSVILSEKQREKLNSIGMVWKLGKTPPWDVMYMFAEEYYQINKTLSISVLYQTAEGFKLGRWISRIREIHSGKVPGTLTQEQIERLNSIGMIW